MKTYALGLPLISGLWATMLLLSLTGCPGGGGTTPDPSPVPKTDPPVTYDLTLRAPATELRDRAVALSYDIRTTPVDEPPADPVRTVLTVQFSLDLGANWQNATELRATGTGRQRGIPQELPQNLTTRLTFFWDAESDLRIAGAESGPIEVRVRVISEQLTGPGEGASNRIPFVVNWSSTGGCVVNAPSIQTGKELILEAGKPANRQMLSAGGDLPLIWKLDGALPGTLRLDSSGALTGTPTVFDGIVFLTVTDSCSAGPRRDFQFMRLRVIPPECTPLRFGPVLTIPEGEVGQVYNVNLRDLLEADGKGTLTWTLDSLSRLPDGVTLTSTGRLQGTPVNGSAGFYSLTVTIRDSCEPPQTETERFLLAIRNPD